MAVKHPKNRPRSKQNKPTLIHPLLSETFDGPIAIMSLAEAAKRSKKASTTSKGKGPQNLSMAWDDTRMGVPGVQFRDGLMTERDRKDTYYRAYIGNTWVSAAIDVIAKRFTSGGWQVEELVQGEGNEANKELIKALLLYVNDDEDFLQFLRAIATDLLIFGEAFCEIVTQNGVPAQLHKIDNITMTTHLDRHGMVTGYTQSLDKSSDTVDFAPEQIIRWWLPDPRASKKALSPLEKVKDPLYLYEQMTTWAQKFFKQGARPTYSIELGEDSTIDDANRFIKFFKENYTGIENAHVPPVNYGGSKLIESSKGSVEMDFLKGRADCRDELLAGFNVPLSLVGVQETAHLGSGDGESATKAFLNNVVKPIQQMILEKFNFRVVQKAFGITDYIVTVHQGEYRQDTDIVTNNDKRIRNGSRTIDEVRQEEGKAPYLKGGSVAVFAVSKEVVPVESFDSLTDNKDTNDQLDIETKQAQLEKLKEPPPPPPTINPIQANGQGLLPQQGDQGHVSKGAKAPTSQGQQTSKAPSGKAQEARTSSYTYETGYASPTSRSPSRDTTDTTADEVELEYNPDLDIWEPWDTDKQLKEMIAAGVQYLRWSTGISASGVCGTCSPNDGEVRRIGETFSSGHRLSPCHKGCQCVLSLAYVFPKLIR